MTEAPVRTPVRTPAGSAKSLQLTPIWEEVVKNQRVPPQIGITEILREIRGRLRAGEWEIRQHALRVLADVLRVTGEPTEYSEMQAALVANLGSPAPGVRRAAREALSQLLRKSSSAESSLLELLGGCNDENVTLGIIIAMPDLLKPFLFPENGGYILSSHCLTAIVVYLVNKVSVPIYRDASVDTLSKIRDMCGEMRFQKCLEHISPDPKTLQLLTMNLDDSGVDFKLPVIESPENKDSSRIFVDDSKNSFSWSDNSESEMELPNSVTTFHNYDLYKKELQGSSEEGFSDGSDETYTKETPDIGKLVLETEIQLSEQRAITMRIMEEGTIENENGVIIDDRFVSADGSLVMSVVPSSDEDALRRTPRRVRFGGEVIKLCTPDSDVADVRIEIEDAPSHSVERMVIERPNKASHIPLPISPATSKPQASGRSPRIRKLFSDDTIKSSSFSSSEDPTDSLLNSSTEIVFPNDVLSLPAVPVIEISHAPINESTAPIDLPVVTEKGDPIENIQSSEISEKESSMARDQEREVEKSSSTDSNDVEPPDEYPNDIWMWESLGLLDQDNMASLKRKDDVKGELSALEQLRRNLQSANKQSLLREANTAAVQALVRFLMEHSRANTAETALYTAGLIMQLLPDNKALDCLDHLLPGLCRFSGGSNSVNVKLAAVDILRILFSRFSSSQVLDILLGSRCLHSPSSKMRENALIVLLHTLMTYPSTIFSTERLVDESCRSAADPRRRVRHAALETLAVLAQYHPSSQILECAAKCGGERLQSAISSRLSRRSLPSVSPDGLVLYALQISSARRLGHTGPPQGADVDWILAGTGSLSTGSARSRGQLQAGPRWGGDSNVIHKAKPENPWTAQSHRMEDSLAWALVPVSTLDEGAYQGSEHSYLGAVRPLFVKLSGDETLRSQRYAVHRVSDAHMSNAPIRVLTPSMLRRIPDSKSSPWTESRSRDNDLGDSRRAEHLPKRKVLEAPPRSILVGSATLSDASTPPAAAFLPSIHGQEKVKMTEKPRGLEPTNIRFVENYSCSPVVPNPQSLSKSLPVVYREEVPGGRTPSLEIEQVITINPNSRVKSQEKLFERLRLDSKNIENDSRLSATSAPAAITGRDRNLYVEKRDKDSFLSSNVYADKQTSRDRESLQSNNVYIDKPSQHAYKPAVINDEEFLNGVNGVPFSGLNKRINQRVKNKRRAAMETPVKNSQQLSDTSKPFDRPKEGMESCCTLLDSPQWETTMLGLASLVRLVRHHPGLVTDNIHTISSALSRHINNLRSQVSRAACNVAAEMFLNLKRTMETELEEVASALFNRVADTNKFIRADSNKALDAMVDSVTPTKAIGVILTKGVAHQNAVVRTSAARLFLRINDRIGPQGVFGLHKDLRNKMLNAGAGLLTEGRLETRSIAKELFRNWSSQPEFGTIILEAVPANVMRNISKTLSTLRN